MSRCDVVYISVDARDDVDDDDDDRIGFDSRKIPVIRVLEY
jgi:hypothetical protein